VNGFVQKVRQHIQTHQLAEPHSHVVVAASGGPDSTALVYALHALQYRLTVVYVDHGTRPETSEESDFVQHVATTLSQDFRSLLCHPSSHTEGALRDARYAALATVEGDRLATGHTATDQAETVLMRLLRGAGTVGLSGIPPRRQRIIRPLLALSRLEVIGYLQDIDASYCVDPTNEELDALRNRVRHQLMPLLRDEYQPNLSDVLVRMADALRRDRRFLEAAATKHVSAHGLDVEALKAVHPDLVPHILRTVSPVPLTAERIQAIERLVHNQGGAVQLEGNVLVELPNAGKNLLFRILDHNRASD
jgi:tRNA(Ile)-lysidine synthase